MRVVHPVHITPPETFLLEDGTNIGDLMGSVMRSQARAGCETYLRTLDDSDVRTLEDIIEYNEAHADREFDAGRSPSVLSPLYID
jgi:amidase